ncbi:MAG: 1-deoxy-D-xylulose-5-phosphate synthase [Phycisphaerales bacterium]|nr:1-deoxy-D-xylulose-5-phosphate synthase [Planctomycetota bacterium]MCH8508357.1 1-deoxy-D-xylulose-5-phosphate synthase [Phycisphaerales bacterium]
MTLLQTLTGPSDLRQLSVEQLGELAQEIREAIITQVSSTGGHLAPNLGVVELTLAMHRVFDFGHDRLLFDVGHQCYPHKLITGRYPLLSKLRTREGMAGFPEPNESRFDLFRVGHAGTGISTAVGMARGDTLNGEGYDPKSNPDGRRVATIIGDASIVNGVAMEGLNGAGVLKRQFLVVLNDNGMSISKPQGAMAQYFDRVRVSHTYTDFKKGAKELLKHVPGGDMLREAYHRMGEMTKAAIAEDSWFEKFGLLTVGPIDGHDLPTLIEFLTEARDMDRPMVLHVKTVKGKGLDIAELDATKFHSPKAFKVERDEVLGCRIEMKSGGRSFTAAFADALVDLMDRDPKAVTATAAMPDGTGVIKAMEKHPERSFDTGICESHAMDMMAGMAKTGLKPFFAVYSTFLQRAFDQAFQEVSLQGLPVRLCLDRAGLVGGDGAVHHGFCDVAILRTLPDAVLTAAIDEPSLQAALEFMRTWEGGLSSVRYPRDDCSERFAHQGCPAFELGKARLLTPEFADLDSARPDAAVLAFGTPAIAAMDAREQLGADYRVAVWDARFAKPVDTGLIRSLLERGIPVLTLEDHSVIGGFGTAVIETAQEMGLDTSRVVRHGIPDHWIMQDSRNRQLAEVGLDAAGIARMIRHAADPARHDRFVPARSEPLAREAHSRA